jgi:hypothetical protein
VIDLAEADFYPLDAFALRHRFVERGRTEPMSDVVLRLRPIVKPRAAELASIAASLCGDSGVDAATFRSDDQPEVVAERLRELPPQPESSVIVSWNATTAALTDWMLFTARWDQFCHAAADDLTVWPLAGTWHLCYRRYDVFQFHRRSSVM